MVDEGTEKNLGPASPNLLIHGEENGLGKRLFFSVCRQRQLQLAGDGHVG